MYKNRKELPHGLGKWLSKRFDQLGQSTREFVDNMGDPIAEGTLLSILGEDRKAHNPSTLFRLAKGFGFESYDSMLWQFDEETGSKLKKKKQFIYVFILLIIFVSVILMIGK